MSEQNIKQKRVMFLKVVMIGEIIFGILTIAFIEHFFSDLELVIRIVIYVVLAMHMAIVPVFLKLQMGKNRSKDGAPNMDNAQSKGKRDDTPTVIR